MSVLNKNEEDIIKKQLENLYDAEEITNTSSLDDIVEKLNTSLNESLELLGTTPEDEQMRETVKKIMQLGDEKNSDYFNFINSSFNDIKSPTNDEIYNDPASTSSSDIAKSETLEHLQLRSDNVDKMSTDQFINYYENIHQKILDEIAKILEQLNTTKVKDLPALKELVKRLTGQANALLQTARKTVPTRGSNVSTPISLSPSTGYGAPPGLSPVPFSLSTLSGPTTGPTTGPTAGPFSGGSQKRHRKRNKKTQRRRKTGKRMKFRL
jgi:hypothetical protein